MIEVYLFNKKEFLGKFGLDYSIIVGIINVIGGMMKVSVLRTVRVSQGFSQEDLAVRTGVKQATISRIEGGSRRPSATLARKIADALGIQMKSFYQEKI